MDFGFSPIGKVYSLGRKEYGRLGMGEIESDLSVPTLIPKLNSEKCIEVTAGEAVSLAVTESGTFLMKWISNQPFYKSRELLIRICIFMGNGYQRTVG